MAKISRIEEVKERFAGAADKIAAKWVKARDEGKFYEKWKSTMEKLGARIGPVTENKYLERVKAVKPDIFAEHVKGSVDKYFRNYLAGLAV